jgi:NAD(P)-dependent dehydrogenase (short-subunit alcohol dehydrogenase family)
VKSVVVTGASSGIGRACALHLASKGYRVFAGIRSEDAAKAIQTESGGALTPLFIDVTSESSLSAAAEAVLRGCGGEGLHGVVCNAGITVAGPFEVLPMEAIRRQIDVNVLGQISTVKAFLPQLRLSKGRIVFMGSILGRLPAPFLGAYSCAKFALEAAADSLAMELSDWGISVSILEPGNVATPIWGKSREAFFTIAEKNASAWDLYSGRRESFEKAVSLFTSGGIPPIRVARVVEKVLSAKRPRARYLVGWDAKLLGRLVRVSPDRLRHWITRRFFFNR